MKSRRNKTFLIPKVENELKEGKHKAAARLLEESVTPLHIAQVVASATGIPVQQLERGEKERLLKMESEIEKRVVGQDEVVNTVCNVVRQSRAGLRSKNKPLGVFLFLGPTGTGKTELCKAVAQYLFDDESHMVRIDMSEYQEKHSISRLIGAPPGYVGYEAGGMLTEAVRRRPYQVILFDEFEKAHKEVGNVLLQVFDEGRLTDSHGRTVDFRNTIIVMTSNLGSRSYDEAPNNEKNSPLVKEKIMEAVRGFFTPELLNRVDDICIFNQLSRKNMDAIVIKEFKSTQDTLLADHDISLEMTPALRTYIADLGFDIRYGARPLRRTIQKYILNPLSTKLIDGTIMDGDKVVLDVKGEEVIINVTSPNKSTSPPKAISQG